MFFTINEEVLRQMRERAKAAQAKPAEEAGGPRYYMHSDGAMVIDDPSLLISVTLEDGSPTEEELDNTFFLHPTGQWVPIRMHPDFAAPSPQPETPTNKEQP